MFRFSYSHGFWPIRSRMSCAFFGSGSTSMLDSVLSKKRKKEKEEPSVCMIVEGEDLLICCGIFGVKEMTVVLKFVG